MNFNLIISGLAGVVVGSFCYLVMSNPSYAGSAGEGLGQYLLWLFALAAIVSLLVAIYGFFSGGNAVSK